MKKIIATFFNRHTLLITILVYVVMTVSSWIPFNFKALNPFKKSLKDYDATDIVFSQFKEKNATFDDRIVLVNIGRPDRQEINEVIGKIDGYSPKVIGVDIHFEDFHSTKIDSNLQATLHGIKNVILAKRLSSYSEELKTYESLEGCHDFFCDSVNVAYTNFYARPDMTIRQLSTRENIEGSTIYGLGAALAVHYDKNVEADLLSRDAVQSINYIGDRDAFINISKSQILGQTQDLVETFRDKIVLVGYLGEDEWDQSVRDKFITPMNGKIATKSMPDMYGMTIHANIIHMILEGDYIHRLSKAKTSLINLLLIFLLVAIFNKIYNTINPGYWKIIKVIQLVLFAFLFLVVSGVMYFFDLKLELGVGIIGAVLSWDAVKYYNNLYLKKQKFFKPKN